MTDMRTAAKIAVQVLGAVVGVLSFLAFTGLLMFMWCRAQRRRWHQFTPLQISASTLTIEEDLREEEGEAEASTYSDQQVTAAGGRDSSNTAIYS